MRSRLFIAAVLLCGACALEMVAAPVPAMQGPVCSPESPCVYTGEACTEGGSSINIAVYLQGQDFIAKFTLNNVSHTVYCISNGDGRWYFNWKSKKYYFTM